MAAIVDGARFSATSATITAAEVEAGSPGRLGFSGGDPQGPFGQLNFGLGFVTGPGTYPVGVNASTTRGGAFTVIGPRGFWVTPFSGMAGSVTITAIGNGRVRGSFSGVLVPVTPPVYGPNELIITNGQFDVPLSVNYTPPQGDNYGSSFTMNLGGTEWRGTSIYGTGGGTTTIEVEMVAHNGEVRMLLEDVTSPGVYQVEMDPEESRRTIYAIFSPIGPWGLSPLDDATITITTITDTRIIGSISGTLGGDWPEPATRPIQATFDIRTIPPLFPHSIGP